MNELASASSTPRPTNVIAGAPAEVTAMSELVSASSTPRPTNVMAGAPAEVMA
ncbi:hypothetical protein [Actinoplanes sp. ATCC 53533]|uniref:hypothetical protein n=1 Tax=Actinoplanes sp. ATCC 53533 TaxID=1288362 RepID=UPI0013151C4C|nr:hypothetical protein [Actinoplanes sp. ATCC 53533]